MQNIIKELNALGWSFIAMLAIYLNPKWVLKGVKLDDDAIEHAMLDVKKLIALMIIIITVLSLLFAGFEFVQEQEKPGEIFVVLLVHGAFVSVLVAAVAWLLMRDHHHAGLLVGWFVVVYWIPLWLLNMLFEIHAGFTGEKYSNLFLQPIHSEVLMDWHLIVLDLIWLHATAIAVYGLYQMFQIRSSHLWLLGLCSSVLYLLSFLLIYRTQKGVEIIYLNFGMD